jgi:hypothetical protein
MYVQTMTGQIMHKSLCSLLFPGSNVPSSTCRVTVTVSDVNDIPPMFTRTPRGNVIDVRNDAPVGETIGTVSAADSDGTEPGNVVR